MRHSILFLSAIALATTPLSLPAQDWGDMDMEWGGSSSAIEKALDLNGDGSLSASELQLTQLSLRLLDENGDGTLSKEELGSGGGWDDDWGDGDWGGGDWGRGSGRDRGAAGSLIAPPDVPAEHGQATLPDRETFRRLSYKTGMVMDHLEGQEFVKFQIMDADTAEPKLYFINTAKHATHMTFMSAIGGRARDGMRGVLVRRPQLLGPDGQPGMFTFEFDLPKVHPLDRLQTAFRVLQEQSDLLRGRLMYHPLGDAVASTRESAEQFAAREIPVIFTDQLHRDVGFLPLHPAESYGRLRMLQPQERPSPRDIVICQELPNEMPRVAGIVSAVFQTPLSHVNLRAIQDRVPHAFVEGGARNPQIAPLVGEWVYYRVDQDGFQIRSAKQEEVEQHFAALRPPEPQVPPSDLSIRAIRSLDDISFADSASVGVKAANLAELRKIDLPCSVAPIGFAVPFSFYDAFMKANGFDERIRKLLGSKSFEKGREARAEALAQLRHEIENGRVPRWMSTALKQVQQSVPAGTSLRCRSSTNNEDLPGFSGAGLYDSFTHKPSEGHLSKSIKQVYASLWNDRAFEEREFFRVDHFATAMAVLIHPNYPEEQSNGVAVTEDVLHQGGSDELRYYVNTQIGDDLVTNPQNNSTPEEMLLSPKFAREDELIRSSNRVAEGTKILSDEHLLRLRLSLGLIQRHFRSLYGAKEEDLFAMEVEFKVTSEGEFVIKQARPWVFSE